MTLLDASGFKERQPVLPQGVTDAALTGYLNTAEDEITARRGTATGPITELIFSNRLRTFRLRRPAKSSSDITSVIEIDAGVATAVATNDWSLHSNLMTMVRLGYGSNPRSRWPDQVQVTFNPRDDTNERIRVQILLVKLDLAYDGFSGVSLPSGDSRQALANYHLERAALLASFALTDEKAY